MDIVKRGEDIINNRLTGDMPTSLTVRESWERGTKGGGGGERKRRMPQEWS